MVQFRQFAIIPAMVITGIFMTGCAPWPREALLALTFAQGDRITYQWSSEFIKHVDWEGLSEVQSTSIKEGGNRYYSQILYEQHVDHVNLDGSAVVTIRILQLKVTAEGMQSWTMNYDSTRPEDQDHALGALIGQTYSIELAPHGHVRVMNAEAIRDAVKGDESEGAVVLKLFADDAIQTRHRIKALPLGAQPLAVGATWHQEQSVDIKLLGKRVFDKTYTLASIKKRHGRPLAFVDMQAELISTAANEETEIFVQMFDTSDMYKGWMVFDMASGMVRTYAEDLDIEWVAVNPTMDDSLDQDTKPITITMRMSRHDRLKRVD